MSFCHPIAETQKGACPFGNFPDGDMYLNGDERCCPYHAPMNAIRVRDGIQKKDMSAEDIREFNDRIIEQIRRQQESFPEYPGIERRESIVKSLNATFGDAPLGPNEIESAWARRLIVAVRDLYPPHLNFAGVVFPSKFELRDMKVKAISFDSCEFSGDFNIENCEFEDVFRMSQAKVRTGFYATGTRFRDKIDLSGTSFRGPAMLCDSQIDSTLNIQGCEFRSVAHFCCSERGSDGKATQQTLTKLNASGARFLALACFRHRLFDEIEMDDAEFSEAPRFGGSRIETKSNLSAATYESYDYASISEFETLRQLAASMGDRRGVEMFRAAWFACLTKSTEASLLQRWILRLYGITSRYGTSIERSVVGIVAFNTAALCLELLIGDRHAEAMLEMWARAMFKPFDSMSDRAIGYLDWILAMQSLGTVALTAICAHTIYRSISRD